MARMYPNEICDYEDATEGEKKVFRFIKEAARPNEDFICWYEPPIGSSGKEPDFVLFSKRLGLLVIEVKDWTSKQIISFNPNQFTILEGESQKKRTNPDKQAKGYVNALKNSLQNHAGFLSDNPRFQGNLKIPIGRMVVFPNMSRDEYAESRYKWFIASERALFKDDLDPTGEILCDETGNKFVKRIAEAFPFRFTGLTQKEIEKLCFLIWPDVQIKLPLRHGAGKERFQAEVRALDESQARLALHLSSGHHLIKGPPGSGKTLVLVYRCCNLFKFEPRVRRILLVCYNIALVAYLKRLVQECGAGIGDKKIHVAHFYELCEQILGESVHFENEDADYYDIVIQETLEKIHSGKSKLDTFDAIFIDEGQDFNNEMLRVIMSMLRPSGDLVIGLDSCQDLYRRTISWKSLGIQASGRTRHLK
ncbi:MAG: NERD domain-containing protein/DEAD/DEAH box helicase, partial [Deltaproteobacteria bacterium]|nr:NERD domain-containing protein/DEAD/DEAH box helicase [Deltaproteobacteria bacterium]